MSKHDNPWKREITLQLKFISLAVTRILTHAAFLRSTSLTLTSQYANIYQKV